MRTRLLLALLPIALSAFGADPAWYAKDGDWRTTLIMSREGLAKAEAEAEAAGQAKPADQVSLSPWQRIGPFAEPGTRDFGDAAPPERAIELNQTYGVDKLAWRQENYADGVVHNLPAKDAANTYLYRVITSTRPVKLTGHFGSDDGLVVWLNGDKLLSQDVPRGAGPNQAAAALDLKTGENALLLKIHNITGDHAFYFSLDELPKAADPKVEARRQLFDLIWRDFGAGPDSQSIAWERNDGLWNADWPAGDVKNLAQRYVAVTANASLKAEAQQLADAVTGPADLAPVAERWERSRRLALARSELAAFDAAPLRRALVDLSAGGAEKYPRGPEFAQRLEKATADREAALADAAPAGAAIDRAIATAAELATLRADILLSNPLLADVQEVLYVRRGAGNLGLPQNWQGNTSIARTGYDNQIRALRLADRTSRTVYAPEGGRFVGNLMLNWDARRLLFSMPSGEANRWQIQEIGADGSGYRQVGPADEPDVDNYDACYLPDGKIIFCSTRVFQGVPCVAGSDAVGNLCVMNNDGTGVRMLAFDQDHNWCPTITNDGRVMYTRWEYSDTAHYFTRLLFRMNPDGTRQTEMYGSNSYWPNSMFYSRAIPNDPSKVVTIVSGHHGVPRMGELVVLDPARGRREAQGAVQRIPGWGKPVAPIIADELVANSWPKFLHPYPLSDKYFLVSAKITPEANWGLYLVDVFDNMLLLSEEDGYALLEPVAIRQRPTPPVIPDAIDLNKSTGTVYIADLYTGPGLAGIPRGTVKNLRFYSPHYGYNNMGGHINVGIEGPWDVRRILGTVPVQDDGSVAFTVPANTPVAFQPLDAEGRALQQMRSWYTAMPGERISCIGCHENPNDAAANRKPKAAALPPADIKPWRGPVRGFSWKRDVQPQVLDRFCVGCHDGQTQIDGKVAMDLRDHAEKGWGGFDQSYIALHPYVRRHGPEGDDRLLTPMDFFANTSELVQMLEKGHYNVKLDPEAWDRLYTWIDLNLPDHGTWSEHQRIPGNEVGSFHDRRLAMRDKYAGLKEDPELIAPVTAAPLAYEPPAPEPARQTPMPAVPGWPFDAQAAQRLQVAAANAIGPRLAAEGSPGVRRTLDLGGGQTMEFVLVPAGEFAMGSASGPRDEYPVNRVRIAEPFWMSVTEVTNAQFQRFDPDHDSRFIDQQHKDHTTPGYPANLPDYPVIRVSWQAADDFCAWLSRQTGASAGLPTEAQWEWACRAGSDTPFWFGGLDTAFAPFANLADQSIKLFAVDGVNPQPVANPNPIFQDFVPRERRFNDGQMMQTNVGSYQPNAWGLRDMHGNVAEWTASDYVSYPYADDDGRNERHDGARKVVRGGSWRERPFRATSSWRLGYYTYQPSWDVGLRVVLAASGSGAQVAAR